MKVKRCGLCNQKEKKISIDSAGEHDFSPHGAHTDQRPTPTPIPGLRLLQHCYLRCCLLLLLLLLQIEFVAVGSPCLSLCQSDCLFVCFSLWTSAWAHEQLPEGTQHEPRPCGQAHAQATSAPAIADNKHGSRQRLVAFIRQTCRQDAQRHGRPSSSSFFSCCLSVVCPVPVWASAAARVLERIVWAVCAGIP